MSSKKRRWTLRWPSLALLLVLSSVSLAAADLVASDAQSEQHSLLNEKTTVAGLLVSNVFSEFGQNISQLSVTMNTPGEFDSAAKSLLGEMTEVGLL